MHSFEKLVHRVGFIVRIVTMYGHLNVKFLIQKLFMGYSYAAWFFKNQLGTVSSLDICIP